MGISARRYRADRQNIMDKVKTKATKRQIVYNLSESKRTDFASMGIFLLIIVNFILRWLFPLSTIVANFVIAQRKENNNGHPGGFYGRTAWKLSLTRLHLAQTSLNVVNYIIWPRCLKRSNFG